MWGSGPAGGVRRIGMSVALVAVPDAVVIAVDTEARSSAGRHAGEGHGATVVRGEGPQRGLGDRRQRASIAPEQARSDIGEASLDALDLGLGDEIAFSGVRAL